MTDEQNNKDSTKEYKELKKQLDDAHDETRIFERVTGEQAVPQRPTATGEQRLSELQAEEETKQVEVPEQTAEQPAGVTSAKKPGTKKSRKPLAPWLEITLKISRILFIPLLCIIALYIGIYIGYVTFGKENPGDIWDFGTWKHIFDLIFADGSPSTS